MASCTWSTDKSIYPSSQSPELQLLDISVDPGEIDVAVNRSFYLSFSHRLDPLTVNGDHIQIRAGGALVTTRFRSDYLTCETRVTPTTELSPGLTHSLEVSEDLLSIHGSPLEEPFSLSFTTGDATTFAEPKTEPIEDGQVQTEVFDRHCGCCHDPQNGEFNHILALEASNLASTTSRQNPDMKLVSPGSHAQSYLLHKVLGLPTITGEPMPPSGYKCQEEWPPFRQCPNQDPTLKILGDWIYHPPR